MVRKLTTILGKEIVALLQSINHICKLHDVHIANLTQLFYILRELSLLNVHSLVRTPGRNHHRVILSLGLGILNVVMQIINRIIGSTYTLHVVMLHQATSRELWLLKFLITLIKNLACCLWRELLRNTKSSLQLQMSPMIKRVTECIRNGLSPLLEFLPIRGILTGAILLVDTIGTHGTPLIVVATQPQLSNTLKLVVFGHHLRNQMTMIVDNGHFSRMIVIQVLCHLGLQNKVLIIELLHKTVCL